MLTAVKSVELTRQGATIYQLRRKRSYKIDNGASLRVRSVSQDSTRDRFESNGVAVSVKTCNAIHCCLVKQVLWLICSFGVVVV